MKISELIKELEDFLERHGDLEVRHTIGRVGDVDIDSVNIYKAHICLLNNHYLDNYTLRTSDKIKNIEKDIKEYVEDYNINCRKCKYYYNSKCLCDDSKLLLFSEREWIRNKEYLFECYSPKDARLEKLFYYRYLLLKEYDKKREWYENNGVEWDGSI